MPHEMYADPSAFTFVVGPNKSEFQTDRDVIARLSPVLDTLVNGSMREARDGRAEWPDIDADTFARFVSFATGGDYEEAASSEADPGRRQHDEAGDEDGITAPVAEAMNATLTGRNTAPRHVSEAVVDAESDLYWPGPESSAANFRMAGTDEMYDEWSDQGDSDLGEDPDYDDMGSDDSGSPPTEELGYDEEDWDRSAHHDGTCSSESSPLQAPSSPKSIPYKRLPFDLASYLSDDDQHRDMLAYYYHGGGPDPAGPPSHPPRSSPMSRAARRFRSHLDALAPPAHLSHWVPRPNSHADEPFLPVLLSHADLYVLADRYGVDALRRLSLHRLLRTLLVFTVYPSRVADLVSLTEGLYARTAEGDTARAAMAHFWSCFVEHVGEMDCFVDLLRREADFSVDLVRATILRLV